MKEQVWSPFLVNEQIHITEMHSFFKIHYKNGYTFSGEAHNFWECLYVLNGEVCVSADERVYNLKRGDIIFHKPLEFHKFYVNCDKGADLLIFSFTAEGPLTGWLRNKVFNLSEVQKHIINSLLSFVKNQNSLNSKSSMKDNYLFPYSHTPYYLQMVVTYLYQLFLLLASDCVITSTSSAPDAILFSKAINYMNTNMSKQPSIEEIAHFCNVSTASLKRIFDKYAGIGVHSYLLKLKIKASMELLRDGESVSVVAEKTGFNSQSYFSKAFKRETGIKPSEFHSI